MKKIWISSGVERMSSTRIEIGSAVAGKAMRVPARTRPRVAAITKPRSVASMVTTAARARSGRISKAKDQSQIIGARPRARPRAARSSAKRMPMVRTSDSTR